LIQPIPDPYHNNQPIPDPYHNNQPIPDPYHNNQPIPDPYHNNQPIPDLNQLIKFPVIPYAFILCKRPRCQTLSTALEKSQNTKTICFLLLQ
jgi:hypothetical protein